MINLVELNESNIVVWIANIIRDYIKFDNDVNYDIYFKPEINITIEYKNNFTYINVLHGKFNFKKLIGKAVIKEQMKLDNILNIISLILKDYKNIVSVNFDDNVYEMHFITDINNNDICNNIELKLDFGFDYMLAEQCVLSIFTNFSKELNKCLTLKRWKSNFMLEVKKNYIKNLNKNELMNIVDYLTEEELKEILFSINDELFLDLYKQNKILKFNR